MPDYITRVMAIGTLSVAIGTLFFPCCILGEFTNLLWAFFLVTGLKSILL